MKKRKFFAAIVAIILLFAVTTSAFAETSIYAWSLFPQARKGDSGYRVRALQTILMGYNATTYNYINGSGGADGAFGNDTREAVKVYQSAYNLGNDGVVGPNTWSALSRKVTFSCYDGNAILYETRARYNSSDKEALFRAQSAFVWQFRKTESNSWHTISG